MKKIKILAVITAALVLFGVYFSSAFAFGDGLNDLEMMGTVGHALVMGNAGPELKALAVNSLRRAFVSEARKAELIAALERDWEELGKQ